MLDNMSTGTKYMEHQTLCGFFWTALYIMIWNWYSEAPPLCTKCHSSPINSQCTSCSIVVHCCWRDGWLKRLVDYPAR